MSRQLRAVFQLPFTVTLLVPAAIVLTTGNARLGPSVRVSAFPLQVLLAFFFVSTGILLMLWTISLFSKVGEGTPAPWDPPHKLVVVGPYLHVRTPMITGIFAVLLGETVLFGSIGLLVWFLIVVVVNLIYMPLVKEPQLERRFGDVYRLYKANVPRWIPRWKV